jgi:hypothetical protein
MTATAPPGGETYSGMAVDPTDGTVYAASTSVVGSTLLTIDLTTGAATVVGAITNAPGMIGIAVDGNGDLWGYDIVADVLLSIDKSTGAGTIVGAIGFDANFGQGMGWDPATDTVLMAAFNNATFQAELRAVDTATGNTTLLGVLGATTPGGLNQLSYLGIDVGGGGCTAGDIPWASASPTSGTTAAGETDTIEVVFDSTGMSAGVYTGTLCVESDDPDEPEVLVDLTLEVTEVVLEPDITVDPLALSATLEPGQTTTDDVVIGNVGTAALDWTVVEAADDSCVASAISWASADPTSGTTAAGGSSTVTVTFDATGLAVGTYEGALCVNSNDPDEPQVAVALTLVVTEPQPVDYDLYLPAVMNAPAARQAAATGLALMPLLGGLVLLPMWRRRR